MTSVTDKSISRAIDKLLEYVVTSDTPIKIDMAGTTILVDRKYVKALRAREDTHLCKENKGTKKTKEVSSSQRSEVIDALEAKVDRSLQKAAGIKVSANLRKAILEHVRVSLEHRSEAPKTTTFVPRLLYYIDDHFATFLKDINLGLLSRNFEGRGSAALRKELTELENSYVQYLTHEKVGASTVLNALISYYTKSVALRSKDGGSPSMIKMDARLQKFLEAPMNSMFNSESMSKHYVATNTTKTIKDKKGGEDEVKGTLAGYRMENPRKSVKDYLISTSTDNEVAAIKNGYLMGKHIMSLVSAHLIPASSFPEEDREQLSMEMVNDEYTNPNVYTLISLQAIITASHEVKPSKAADTSARSPTRSPARSSRSGSQTPSRSPTRSASRGVSRGRSRS